MVEHEGVGLSLKSEGVIVNLGGGERDCVGLLCMAPNDGGLNGVSCLKEGLCGGERFKAIVAVSWGCLYSEAVRSLCRVWMMNPRRWRRHSVGLRPAKAGL
jgi:hypothetical protein